MEKKPVSYNNIDSYIQSQPELQRAALKQLRQIIKEVAPLAVESISYGMPAYKHHGPLVYFGAFKNHCSFFPGSATAMDLLIKELHDYKINRGTLQIANGQPIPADLIKRIVSLRMKQNEEKMWLKSKATIKKK
jgi:uncharacterized protein YdhG (YjbR/CyaY superfamily)